MGSRMDADEVENLMKEADTQGDGYIHIAEMAERLCPPKNWMRIFSLYHLS